MEVPATANSLHQALKMQLKSMPSGPKSNAPAGGRAAKKPPKSAAVRARGQAKTKRPLCVREIGLEYARGLAPRALARTTSAPGSEG
jgi:hypothetical protein